MSTDEGNVAGKSGSKALNVTAGEACAGLRSGHQT